MNKKLSFLRKIRAQVELKLKFDKIYRFPNSKASKLVNALCIVGCNATYFCTFKISCISFEIEMQLDVRFYFSKLNLYFLFTNNIVTLLSFVTLLLMSGEVTIQKCLLRNSEANKKYIL